MTSPVVSTRNTPSAIVQWWVLTLRVIAPSLRNGELALAVIAPVVFTIAIYIPLHGVMTDGLDGSVNYAQFIMPMILLQGATFSSITAAFRSATDQVDGINRRFSAMPIAGWTPVASRMASNIFRAALCIASAIACGYVIGFRFYLTLWHTIAFCLVAMLIALVLALLADVLGSASKSPEAVSQAMIIPQMFFGLLSSGFAPEKDFPGWLGPFVRYQPVSQFSNMLRALSGEGPDAVAPTWGQLMPGFIWAALFIAILAPLAVRLNSRRS